jgi:transketolase
MKTSSLRKAYGEALVEVGKNEKVVALEADLGKSTMSVYFQDKYPERYFQMGIAEQNMMSTAAGLALGGKIPFASTFAVFATGRPYDQIRSSIAIPNLSVMICGSSAGLSDFGDGKTHQSIDDIGIMRVLPHMSVLCPADAIETKQMVRAMLDHEGPVYLRVSRAELPELTDESKPYVFGQMTKMREGSDAVIFACGTMVSLSLKAAEMLEEKGISARVVNLSTIKPLNIEQLKENIKGVKAIITAEEHNIYCGMGSAVAEALGDCPLPLKMVGIKDSYGTSAKKYEELLEKYEVNENNIAEKVEEALR